MHKLLDLRFVIGVFFLIVGLMLLAYSFMSDNADAAGINRWCGALFSFFGVVMVVLSLQKDAHDELLPGDGEEGSGA